ncbi:ankyrin repeat domain-containing protein [Chitinophaga varians]|uniref:ankyrin repeat domain-containing protein n=1 Tax=Chitinophaga varians TaxID=2202339 RepID=UPI00165F3EE7|nr:ankyrin repeat domain-containing protein [Chitinophaga varians]MBC9912557.1 ankyrin repeat domain-containing protein [Chitinophaga varians]
MSFFKKWFNKAEKEEPNEAPLPWIEPAQNPWGVRLLDLRPVTTIMLATSKDPQCASNAVSYNAEDGTTFIDEEPSDNTIISSNIVIPIDKVLAPGVLFIPQTMEHKWAIYYHNDTLIFVRSWLRKVVVTAKTTQRENTLTIDAIKGKFLNNESTELTRNIIRFLLIGYAMNEVTPAPIPPALALTPQNAALWAFSAYGNMAHFGVFDEHFEPLIDRPLRSHSLLHIAVAQGNIPEIEKQFQTGLSLDLLAGDGLAPLHWSIASKEIQVMEKLLALGAHPDSRSEEGATPLMNAVQSNKIHHVDLLLQSGANPNAIDNRGFTSLHRAAEMGHLDIVITLLKCGADKNISSGGHTALSFAEGRGHEAIVKVLQGNNEHQK